MCVGFKCKGDACEFSPELVSQVAIPVLADYILGMMAVADIEPTENFDDAYSALWEYGFLKKEGFLENNREYFYSMSDLSSHFDAAMIVVQAEVMAMQTDDEWYDFLAKHYEAVKAFFPSWYESGL